jgi:DNA invertase Pin-like site-specific DNA recombinase
MLNARGVQLRSLNENLIDTTSASGKFLFGIFALMAEFERDMLRQRTTAGLVASRKRIQRRGVAADTKFWYKTSIGGTLCQKTHRSVWASTSLALSMLK